MQQESKTDEGTVQAAVIVQFCNADTGENDDCMNKQYVVGLVCQDRTLQVNMRDLCMHVLLPAPETSPQRQL